MTTNEELVALAQRSALPNYRPGPFVLSRGQGCEVWDVEGRRFLDLSGGIAVVSVGHCHPKLAKAIADQAATLMHVSNLFYNDKAIRLAHALTERTCFDRIYFANSGTEANEALFKMARRYHYEQGDEARTDVISTHRSFHGRTMGALTLTGQPKYHDGMRPLVPGVSYVEYNQLEQLAAAMNEKTAAVILEPIQAEGGIIVGDDAYLQGVRRLCDERGALLLFDEVQTGYGRTGKFLGREWSGVVPDACSLAKGIAGGFPLAAMAVTEKLAHGLPPGSHASTFGGNALACAAGLAVLEIFDEEGLVEASARTGAWLRERLEAFVDQYSAATEVRGRGLLQGIALADDVDPMPTLHALRDRGLLVTLAGGTVLRIAPPLNVKEQALEEGLALIAEVLGDPPRKAES